MYDWFNVPYESFIDHPEEYNANLLRKSEILKLKGVNEQGKRLYKILIEFEKYYCFIREIFNSDRAMNTVTNIKLVNLRNVSFSTLYLIKDALQLMYSATLYGANIISRTILENTVTLLVLFNGDNEMSERYHEWQVLSKRKFIDPIYKFRENLTSKQKAKREFDDKEFEDFKKKYKNNELYKKDYGWAYGFLKRENGEPIQNFVFDDLAKMVLKDSVIVYKYLNSLVHMTSFQVHSDEIDEFVYNHKFIALNYKPVFVVILWALGAYAFIQKEVFEQESSVRLESFLRIDNYYQQKCGQALDTIKEDDHE